MRPQINGEVHLVLVVTDVERSAEWYARVFGFTVVRDGVEAVLRDAAGRDRHFTSTILFKFPTRLFLGLAEPAVEETTPFDWCAAGIQHLGLHVDERAHLDEFLSHLDALGVEHSPILTEGPGLLVRCHDPDGIPVEVYWADWTRGEAMFQALARSRASAARDRRRRRRST